MNSSLSSVKTHREALDPSILLCRDRLECSLILQPKSIPQPTAVTGLSHHSRSLWATARLIGPFVAISTAAVIGCLGGFLAHIAL